MSLHAVAPTLILVAVPAQLARIRGENREYRTSVARAARSDDVDTARAGCCTARSFPIAARSCRARRAFQSASVAAVAGGQPGVVATDGGGQRTYTGVVASRQSGGVVADGGGMHASAGTGGCVVRILFRAGSSRRAVVASWCTG